jgi:hypothetical protein
MDIPLKDDDHGNAYEQTDDMSLHSQPSYDMKPFTRVHEAEVFQYVYAINPKASGLPNA